MIPFLLPTSKQEDTGLFDFVRFAVLTHTVHPEYPIPPHCPHTATGVHPGAGEEVVIGGTTAELVVVVVAVVVVGVVVMTVLVVVTSSGWSGHRGGGSDGTGATSW